MQHGFAFAYAQNTEECKGHMHVPGQTDPIYEATLRVVLGRLAPIPPPDTSKWFIKRGIRCDQALHIGALNTSSQCQEYARSTLSAHLGTALHVCPSLSLSDSHRSAVCRYCEADQACRIYMYAFHDGKSGGARGHTLHSGSGYDCWVVHNRTESADCLHQDEGYTIGVKRPAADGVCAAPHGAGQTSWCGSGIPRKTGDGRGCYCDDECVHHLDCCIDYSSVCASAEPTSCLGDCERPEARAIPGGGYCWCTDCDYGDEDGGERHCCPDYPDRCGL